MLSPIIQFILSATTIVFAGTFLVRYSDKLAESTRLGRLFVGSVFLAAATSLPELLVDVSAVRQNLPNLAVGDLMGSSLFNLLILAIGDLIHKGEGRVFTRASLGNALSACMSIGMTAIAGVAILLGPRLAAYAVGDFGLGTLAIVLFYVFGLRLVFYDQSKSEIIVKGREPNQEKIESLTKVVIGYLTSALVILIAAPFLARAAGEIAHLSGLGGTFIGTSLVAFCTSLPEFASTISAVKIGAFDLAIGNVFGSNAFNMLLLVPLDLIYPGPLLANVSQSHLFTGLASISITAVALMGQLYQVEKRKRFIEPDAFAVIFLVVLSLVVIFLLENN